MLAVSVAASPTGLTILATVKSDLGITGSTEDTYLTSMIARVSPQICAYLNVVSATDGTRTLGRETLIETFREGRNRDYLILSRYPVTSITSVVEDGVTLGGTEYEVEGNTGLLSRLDEDGEQIVWPGGLKVVVTYIAGWLLPDSGSRNLPADIEAAAISLIKTARSARTRDPMAKRIEIPDVQTTDYWVGGIGKPGELPADVMALLGPYRNWRV
jgi:hypothetical protein